MFVVIGNFKLFLYVLNMTFTDSWILLIIDKINQAQLKLYLLGRYEEL